MYVNVLLKKKKIHIFNKSLIHIGHDMKINKIIMVLWFLSSYNYLYIMLYFKTKKYLKIIYFTASEQFLFFYFNTIDQIVYSSCTIQYHGLIL